MRKKYELTKEDKSFFFTTIHKIIHTQDFLRLKQFYHHGTITTYTHVLKVAYLSYTYAKKKKIKLNYEELIRSALLHDLYFYDWHDKHNGVHLHGLFHPAKAVKNAKKLYQINQREKRNMAHHMFPLTLIPPTTKAGWLICIFDKVAARQDYKALKLRKKVVKRLRKKS